MDADRRFETEDLLEDISSRLWASGPAAMLRTLLWSDVPDWARRQALFTATFDAGVAWRTIGTKIEDEWREGTEQALWQRRLIEHLAVLVCFAERDDPRDYWLWISLHERLQTDRLLAGLRETLSTVPTQDQLKPHLTSRIDWSDLPQKAAARYEGESTASRPWFLTGKRWERLLAGDLSALDKWHPPGMRSVIDEARPRAHPFEVSVMGHYHLTYGRYSSQIHGHASGDPTEWPFFDSEILWLSIVAVLHRLAAMIDHRQAEAQRLAARLVREISATFRFDGPPEVGEIVRVEGEGRSTVLEVANDATVALIRRDRDGQLKIRRSVELLREPN